jgi:N-acetylmuramoyl-L-alanine amidase
MISAMSDEPKLPPDPSSAEPPTPSSDAPPDAPRQPEATPSTQDEVPEWLLRIRARREAEQARSRAARARSTEAEPVEPSGGSARQTPAAAPPRPAPGDKAQPQEMSTPAPPSQAKPKPAQPRPGNEESRLASPAQAAPASNETVQPVRSAPAQPPDSAPVEPPEAATPPPSEEPPAWLKASSDPAAHAPRPDDPPWVQAAAMGSTPAAPGPREAPIDAPDDGLVEDAADLEAAARAARRERMAERRRERRRRERGAVSALQSVIIVGAAAVMIATIFTFWTPASFLSDETREGLRPAYATLNAQSVPTPIPTPVWLRRIGIVSGHWGPHPETGRSDPGAVCPDGLNERDVNRSVAQRVVQLLSGRGYQVDLLDEWDPRLKDYEAAAILSIHADSCHEFDLPGATGFKVAPPSSRVTARADDLRLVDCLVQNYGEITGLPQHPSITRDMTEYHSFGEISSVTPGAIIEIGFLYEDREILTEQPDLLAQGIVDGLLCFLEATPPTPLPELTPWPTAIATPTPLEAPGLS